MADVVAQTVSLLDTDWITANTAGVKPKIDEIFDSKRFRYSKTAATDGDAVWVYSPNFTQEPSGVNSTNVNTKDAITIDVRSMVSRAHIILLRDEVKRILGANFVTPVPRATTRYKTRHHSDMQA